MSKEELFKKYQEIVLKTNGGADDYVVALCQISNLIKEFAEEKDQQIAELQKQLEGKNKTIQGLIETQKYLEKSASYQMFLDIQKQLEEKEKEIDEFKRIGEKGHISDLLEDKRKENKILVKTIEQTNQDKISFCIKQLEKVKGLIANHTQELWTCENDDIDVVLYEEIDKQINELKGKVE